MAGELIRPSDLETERASPAASEFMVVDNGSTVAKTTLAKAVNAGRPLANQTEAEAGENASKAMTPLTVGQAIDARTPAIISAELGKIDISGVESRAWAITNMRPAAPPSFIRTAGYAAPVDGGGALYGQALTEPIHAGKFSITLDDGAVAWYEIAEDDIYLEMVGAKGDGVSNDSPSFQAAVGIGRPVLGRRGATYKIFSELVLPSNTYIDLNGATVDMSQVSGSVNGIRAEGAGFDNGVLLSGMNATAGTYSVDVADASSFAPDEWVLITSEDYYPYSSATAQKGEYKRIRRIEGNTIYFTTPFNDTYRFGGGGALARVRKVTFLENITVKNMVLVGNNDPNIATRGLVLRYCRNILIDNVTVKGQRNYQIEISACLRGRVQNVTADGVFYDGVTGSIFYGIAILDTSTDIIVDGAIGDRNRHLVVVSARSGGQGYYGEPCDITVTNCHQKDSQSGGGGRSYAFEVHGFGRNVKFIGCTADGCYAGWRLENAPGCQIKACSVRNYDQCGIILGSSGLDNRDWDIDLMIDGFTGEVQTSGSAVVWFNAGSGQSFKNINIRVIATRTRDPSNSSGGGVYAQAGTYQDVVISGTIDAGVADADAICVNIPAGADGIRFERLATMGYRTGIRSQANNTHIRFSRFARPGGAEATGAGIRVDGTRNRVQFNEVQSMAIGLQCTGTDCLVTNNTARNCTTATNDTGSGTILRDNDAI